MNVMRRLVSALALVPFLTGFGGLSPSAQATVVQTDGCFNPYYPLIVGLKEQTDVDGLTLIREVLSKDENIFRVRTSVGSSSNITQYRCSGNGLIEQYSSEQGEWYLVMPEVDQMSGFSWDYIYYNENIEYLVESVLTVGQSINYNGKTRKTVQVKSNTTSDGKSFATYFATYAEGVGATSASRKDTSGKVSSTLILKSTNADSLMAARTQPASAPAGAQKPSGTPASTGSGNTVGTADTPKRWTESSTSYCVKITKTTWAISSKFVVSGGIVSVPGYEPFLVENTCDHAIRFRWCFAFGPNNCEYMKSQDQQAKEEYQNHSMIMSGNSVRTLTEKAGASVPIIAGCREYPGKNSDGTSTFVKISISPTDHIDWHGEPTIYCHYVNLDM